jgi:predicted acetyltransferase
MNEVLRRGRERGDVVSALMPFRGSYYEHFGYGFIERRTEWTVPLSIMPTGDFESVRFFNASKDREALEQCRQRIAQRGQCDIERGSALWDRCLKASECGFIVVDRHGDGPVRGWMTFEHIPSSPAGPDTVKTWFDTGYEEIATLKRFLHFLGSLRDQYSVATIQLPHDLPLNLLLKETQMTHRTARNHPTSEMRPFNRMQVRVLDHLKLLTEMRLPMSDRREGKVVVAVQECEGGVSKVAIELSADGKIIAATTQASADVEMPDRIWAAVVTGNLQATRAAELGLISVANRSPLRLLDEFAVGAAPYCREYF